MICWADPRPQFPSIQNVSFPSHKLATDVTGPESRAFGMNSPRRQLLFDANMKIAVTHVLSHAIQRIITFELVARQ
jgi:hypothetical protein